MQKTSDCINCKTYFTDQEHLQLEDLFVEFKNFHEVPVKEPKNRLTLLKTINAFLNTKGGCIYLGVEDSNCRVRGYYLSRKQQDEFRFFIKDLAARMHPKVDFSNREEIQTVYLPVLGKDKRFTGKYIVKILVKQGLTDTFYTFGERIKLVATETNESEEFEIRHGYRRIGAGGLEKMDPLAILQEVHRKAKNPNAEYKTHEGCNPRPIQPVFIVQNIGFKGLQQRRLREGLIELFQAQLQHTPMKCEINYDEDSQLLLVEFEKEGDAENTKNLLVKNLDSIKNEEIELEYLGPDQDSYVFSNKLSQSTSNGRQNSQPKKAKTATSTTQEKQQPAAPTATAAPTSSKNQSKKKYFYYAVTHINPHIRQKLFSYLQNLLQKYESMYSQEVFKNTILLKVDSEQTLRAIHSEVQKNRGNLENFGHNNRVVFGPTRGHLCVYNYFERKRKELQNHIEDILQGKVKDSEFKKDSYDKTRSYIDLTLDPRDAAEALDQLLTDDGVRDYKLYEKDGGAPKMKFMLICEP